MARLLKQPDLASAGAVAALIENELARPLPRAVSLFAERLAARAGGAAAGVLFYGSALRDEALAGMLDFYVLVDRVGAWPGSRLAAAANRVLPPNVGYAEEDIEGRRLRAKYAVMSRARFARAMARAALDTTLWTRFSQPCACAYARSEADRRDIVAALGGAVVTAAWWAAMLGPERGEPGAYWKALYAQTYRLELRLEASGRGSELVARAPERYAALLPAAWQAAGIACDRAPGGVLQPRIDQRERKAALRRWAARQRLGRPLNVMRLVKAAFTFDRAMDYVAWKVERHSGVRLALTPWQRRFPLLAAPGVYYRLRRKGLLR
jgi:hypothetical protein